MEIIEYKEYREDEILRLYAAVGWTAYTENMSTLRQGYEHSLLVLAAYENDELLGIIRVIGDGLTIVFIQDILASVDKGIHNKTTKYGLPTYWNYRPNET